MNKITIVIPCFNESESLPELINQLSNVTSKFSFILVDNGSEDNTQEILHKLEIPENIEFYKKEVNTGYGAGIKYGLEKVKTEYCGWMHSDLQQDASVLLDAHKILEKNNLESSGGNFALKGLRTGRSTIENLFTIGVSILSSILFFDKCWDMAGQPNIFKTSSLKFIDNSPDDHKFEFYIYIIFLREKGHFKRFDAPFRKRKFGSSSWEKGLNSKLKHAYKILIFLLKMRFKSNLYFK